jgi:NAD+ kinase
MRAGTEIFRDFGLNDAVVSRGSAGRTIDLTLSGDGKRLYRFSGDGIIVATPTGSTAYSLAAGGAIVEPSAENIIVTPICAHTLKVKSLVMPAGARVSVEIGELRDKAAFLSVDGADSAVLMQEDVITVTRSTYCAVLVRVLNKSFYDIISLKLGNSAREM